MEPPDHVPRDEGELQDDLSDLMRDLVASAEQDPERADPGAGPAGVQVIDPPPVPDVPMPTVGAGRARSAADEQLPSLADMVRGLNERIARAKRAPQVDPGVGTVPRYVTFSMNGRRYGVPLENVTEVGLVPSITPLPHVPAWLVGVTSLRGRVLALVDLRRLLGEESVAQTSAGRLVVVRPVGGEVFGGLVVDAVHRIREFPEEGIGTGQAPSSAEAAFVRGTGQDEGESVSLLDLDRLLASEMLRQFAAV